MPGTGAARGPGAGDRAERHRLQPDPRGRPALAGFLILLGGSSLAFSLYALSILAVIDRAVRLAPRPHGSPACRASTCVAPCGPACASCATRRRCSTPWCGRSPTRSPPPRPGRCCRCWCASNCTWAPGMYGVILGMMGIGGVTSGMLLPLVRGRLQPRHHVVGCIAVLLRRRRRASACRSHWTAGGVGHAAVRPGLDVGLRHDPGGGAA